MLTTQIRSIRLKDGKERNVLQAGPKTITNSEVAEAAAGQDEPEN